VIWLTLPRQARTPSDGVSPAHQLNERQMEIALSVYLICISLRFIVSSNKSVFERSGHRFA